MAAMDEAEAHDLLAAFRSRTLPKPRWTHEAHVAVCWCVVREMDVDDSVDHLRDAIRSYNEATGTANTPTSGYHETLTRYYVEAVAQLRDAPLAVALAAESCRREAPLVFWSRDVLFGTAARAEWTDPDIEALPWRKSATTSAA
jgi:hypothetical protein